jgi:hypothetical protein
MLVRLFHIALVVCCWLPMSICGALGHFLAGEAPRIDANGTVVYEVPAPNLEGYPCAGPIAYCGSYVRFAAFLLCMGLDSSAWSWFLTNRRVLLFPLISWHTLARIVDHTVRRPSSGATRHSRRPYPQYRAKPRRSPRLRPPRSFSRLWMRLPSAHQSL